MLVLFPLTATSKGSILFLTCHPRPFYSLFTLFLQSISALPPFFPETHNHATTLLGCNSLFIVIHFLVFLSISCSLLLFYLSIPSPYLKMESAQVFSAVFLPFSLHFRISFALLKYSFLNLLSFLVLLLCHTAISQVFMSIFFYLSYVFTAW